MSDVIDESYLPESTMPEERYLQAYFGSQANYYVEKYKAYVAGDKFTFNIAPFFIGFIWFFYRKLWIEGSIIFFFIICSSYVEEFIYGLLKVSASVQTTIFYVSSFVFGMLWAFLGNYLYLKRAEKSINNILSSTHDEEERLGQLTKKGGVSLIPFIIILLIIIYFLLV
ncbi:DUF2628 domain-containing protein [Fulvivirga sp. 29W222]|uniref:DUF2628 domain-containing protein n=1 Tax=Fulvivirga marina TaxID=2494733 RepID=A0A937FYA2_9BACT|nr:DUF2628 domain-containing protein [Fulvivirga marina]MBL6447208.1 DUF2628 domain-containing protein [Fulvivirga marina]